MDLPTPLKASLVSGNIMLVLGAGASFGARHPDNKPAPMGNSLRDLLCARFLDDGLRNSSLAEVAELAISETDLLTVQSFVREVLIPYEPADYHAKLKNVNWSCIATLNYDLIVEKVYSGTASRRLIPWISNSDRPNSSRKSGTDLFLLKIHGCISRFDNVELPMILSPDQFAEHRKGRENVYNELQTRASETPIVFVGTQLVDSDLRILLQWLERHVPTRPRGYIVKPSAHHAEISFWEGKSLTFLRGGFEDFLDAASRETSGRLAAIPPIAQDLPVGKELTIPLKSVSDRCRSFLELDVDYVHAEMPVAPVEPKDFYKGFSKGWGAIARGLDCHRRVTDFILVDDFIEAPSSGSFLYLIHAAAGAGKTVALKRLAWSAAEDLEAFCLYLRPQAELNVSALVEVCRSTDKRIYLFLDNLADHVIALKRLLKEAKQRRLTITVVGAERSNEWNEVSRHVEGQIDRSFPLYSLNASEVEGLLKLLAEHHSLGVLEHLPAEERAEKLLQQDRGQLLVVLHEALLGRPFEDIVVDEYRTIPDKTAQDIYLTTCTLNRMGAPVRAGLVSRIHGVSFDQFQESFLSPLEGLVEVSVGKREYDYEYEARHPHVAEILFSQVFVDRRKLFDRLSIILNSLNLSYDADYRAYVNIVKSRTLKEIFDSHSQVRRIFDIAIEKNPDDGHAYLHRGLYEAYAGAASHDDAEKYLLKAGELLKGSRIVVNAKAKLALERSKVAKNETAREALRKQATRLVSESSNDGLDDDSYTVTLRMRIKIDRVRELLAASNTGTGFIDAVSDVERDLERAEQLFPDDPYVKDVESDFARLVGDEEASVRALERAVDLSSGRVPLVMRLARVYKRRDDAPQALELIRKHIDRKRSDQSLNFMYAKLLIESDSAGDLIEKHLRSSFAPGDKNFLAQKLYGRQLFINGKFDESSEVFSALSNVRIRPGLYNQVDWAIGTGGEAQTFVGHVLKLEYSYGLLKRESDGRVIFAPEESISPNGQSIFNPRDRVEFEIGFNYRGAAAMKLDAV